MADRDNLGLKVQVVSVSEDVPKMGIITIQTEFPMTYYVYSENFLGQFYKRQKNTLKFSPTSFCSEECKRVRETMVG